MSEELKITILVTDTIKVDCNSQISHAEMLGILSIAQHIVLSSGSFEKLSKEVTDE